jgi:hypothetical protein
MWFNFSSIYYFGGNDEDQFFICSPSYLCIHTFLIYIFLCVSLYLLHETFCYSFAIILKISLKTLFNDKFHEVLSQFFFIFADRINKILDWCN